MSEDRERRRAVWWLWLARGLGYGGLAVAFLGFMDFLHSAQFFLLGLVVMGVARAIGVPTGRRLAALRAEKEDAADTARAAGGFTLGCAMLVGTLLLLAWLVPRHLFWPRAGERTRARRAICLSNVKNLALALQMYLADNNDTFPRADSWCESLEEYTKYWDVFQCPAAPDLRCAYAYNRALSGMRLGDLANPPATVAIFESDVGWNAAGDASILPAAPRHLGGDNCGFADGAGHWMSRESLALGQGEIGWSVERGD